MSTPPVDWAALGRGGSRAIATPTLLIVAGSGAMIVLLVLATIGMGGAGAWVLRTVGALLAIPVIMLTIRRAQVLRRFAEMERTGEHPDNVIHATAPDGQEIEVIVPGAERTVLPRLGLGGLTGYSIGALASGGLAFGLFLIVGIARLVSSGG
ncbi:hypothetical protein [Salana multivorans]